MNNVVRKSSKLVITVLEHLCVMRRRLKAHITLVLKKYSAPQKVKGKKIVTWFMNAPDLHNFFLIQNTFSWKKKIWYWINYVSLCCCFTLSTTRWAKKNLNPLISSSSSQHLFDFPSSVIILIKSLRRHKTFTI